MALLAEILTDYLDKGAVQRIARDHDLPVSRNKDEIVAELLSLEDLEPIEAVAFMSVWQLRTFCQEHGIPSGAYRDALVDRVVAAVEGERSPRRERKPRAKPPPASANAAAQATTPTTVNVAVPPPQVEVRVHQAPAVPVDVHVPATRPGPLNVRVEPPQLAAWGFVGVVAAVVFGGVYFLTTSEFGVTWGVTVGLVMGLGAAVALLATAKKWEPWLNRRVQRWLPLGSHLGRLSAPRRSCPCEECARTNLSI